MNKATFPLLQAAAGHRVERTPIWIMRQAGRYLPEYRKLRERCSFLELVHTPELAVEASLMPIKRFDLDAVIIFSDILVPIEAMGPRVEFSGSGPVITPALKNSAQLEELNPEQATHNMTFVYETMRLLVQEVGDRLPVIGFAGAPFTLAAYFTEGKPSTSFNQVRQLLYADPGLYHQLADKLSCCVERHLEAQIEAGAGIVQLFDTWAGLLTAEEYAAFALPYQQRAFKAAKKKNVPTVLFVNGSRHLLPLLAESGADVISIDWRQNLAEAKQELPSNVVLQGNLNPVTLFATEPDTLAQQTDMILSLFPEKQGHIFNLGHGIHPQTPIANVERLIEMVHQHGSKKS